MYCKAFPILYLEKISLLYMFQRHLNIENDSTSSAYTDIVGISRLRYPRLLGQDEPLNTTLSHHANGGSSYPSGWAWLVSSIEG
jgi:hypothetical protein